MTDDEGAASVLGVAVLAATVMLTLALVPLLGSLAVRQHAAGAADAAALAAADVAIGLEPGTSCGVAHEVARANRVSLDACVTDGLVVTVRVVAHSGVFRVAATSTAGPPGER